MSHRVLERWLCLLDQSLLIRCFSVSSLPSLSCSCSYSCCFPSISHLSVIRLHILLCLHTSYFLPLSLSLTPFHCFICILFVCVFATLRTSTSHTSSSCLSFPINISSSMSHLTSRLSPNSLFTLLSSFSFQCCVFSSRLMGRGHYVFDRRWDRMRLALQNMVEKHLNAQMWRWACTLGKLCFV